MSVPLPVRATRPPDTLTGAADRCCAVLCDYRPEAVQVYLNYVLDMERAGEDPVEAARGKRVERNGCNGRAGDGELRVVDVRAAVLALRASGSEVTAIRVARTLCPWALEDE